jgi:hypothetical protein
MKFHTKKKKAGRSHPDPCTQMETDRQTDRQTDIMMLKVTSSMWMDFKKIHIYFQEDNFFCTQIDLLVQDT